MLCLQRWILNGQSPPAPLPSSAPTPFCCCFKELCLQGFCSSPCVIRKRVAGTVKMGVLLYARAMFTVSNPRKSCQGSIWTAAKQNTGAFPVKTSTLLQIEEKLTFWFGVFLQLRRITTAIVLKIFFGSTFSMGLGCLALFNYASLRWSIWIV